MTETAHANARPVQCDTSSRLAAVLKWVEAERLPVLQYRQQGQQYLTLSLARVLDASVSASRSARRLAIRAVAPYALRPRPGGVVDVLDREFRRISSFSRTELACEVPSGGDFFLWPADPLAGRAALERYRKTLLDVFGLAGVDRLAEAVGLEGEDWNQ